ncbi:MAG: O-antigen ligase family protein [Anaerolineae bacterium]|nr:O-antigen ligase family protein [Anaerolineae bacterium]
MKSQSTRFNKHFWVIETLLLGAGAPFLLFPTLRPTVTVGVLALFALWWLARWGLERRPLPPTPFNGALLLWGSAVAVGIAVTAIPALTLPKATGLILGLATWRYLALTLHNRRDVRWGLAGLILVGLSIAGVGLLSVRWSVKIPFMQTWIARLPQQILALPEGPEAGVSANQLGGVLAFYLPLALAAALGKLQAITHAKNRRQRWVAVGLLAGALLGLALTAGLLVLTQSRSAWIGGVVGILALLALWVGTGKRDWPRRAAGATLVVVLVLGGVVYARTEPAQIAALWERPGGVETDVVGTVTLSGRVEIWSRALYAIQDFPFTGCGLGTFREVMWILYPLFTISPGHDIAHAHNMFLQVAVDTGLPGLIAYLALLGSAAAVGWRVARRDVSLRPLALGLLTGLTALHVYGLTDALAPGSKPAVILWLALGLLTGMAAMNDNEKQQTAENFSSTCSVV